MSHCVSHTLCSAGAQACKGYMVVEDDWLVTVMDALHILARLVVGGAPVHMLHHVQVGRDTLRQCSFNIGFYEIGENLIHAQLNYKRTPAFTFSLYFVMLFKK